MAKLTTIISTLIFLFSSPVFAQRTNETYPGAAGKTGAGH